MPHSSRFTRSGNVTLRVMGGKSGKIAARNGKKRQGGRQKRHDLVRMWMRPHHHARGCKRVRWAGLREYAIVKVLARRGGRTVMELIYHIMSRVSSGAAADCRVGKGMVTLRQNPSVA